jgi:hypothetical protein
MILCEARNYTSCSSSSLPQHGLLANSLCIYQDDIDKKHDQISQMGQTYNNALMTIVAMDGDDAHHELHVPPCDLSLIVISSGTLEDAILQRLNDSKHST